MLMSPDPFSGARRFCRDATEVGVDAKTPYQRNLYTPWAQGKDAAAWSTVRAVTDPDVRGGECFPPSGPLRGAPVSVPPPPRTAGPARDAAERLWQQVEELAGLPIAMGPA